MTSLSERLANLQALYDDGKIAKAEYEERRAAMLSQERAEMRATADGEPEKPLAGASNDEVHEYIEGLMVARGISWAEAYQVATDEGYVKKRGTIGTGGHEQKAPAIAAIVGGALMMLGSLLPWASISAPLVGTISQTGTEGDGIITLFLGGVILIVGLVGVSRKGAPVGVGILGLGTAALATYIFFTDYVNLNAVVVDVNDDSVVLASIGVGLWLVGIAAVVAAIGSIGLIIKPRPAAEG